MIDSSIIFLWFVWYIYAYGPPPIVLKAFFEFYYLCNDFLIFYDKLLYSDYWDENIENNEVIKAEEPIKEAPKYEDKYLNDIRKMNKEWIFTDEENLEVEQLHKDFLNGYIECKQNRIQEIIDEIECLNKEILDDTDVVNYVEASDSEGDELIRQTTLEERNIERNNQISTLKDEMEILRTEITSEEGINNLKQESQNQAIKYIINKRIDKLNNSFVIEKTPIGNVLMIYKKETETFQYYSDSNIPYRYLEVVGRKYVKFFNCRPLFVDMEEELKLFEEKWEREHEAKKMREEEEKKQMNETSKNNESTPVKKSVFAKFKSYNKEAGGKISMAAPPKNSIPNKSVNETKDNEKILLKERANRYTYEGKFANFNFLQKIERKVFNKKLGLTFADFKKMQQK
jgi:hypothetical protein